MTAEQSQFDDDKTYVDLDYATGDDDGFDDDATIIRPLDAEMMWVVVTENETVIKLPLTEGVPVGIGRDKNQDAVLVNQMISRRHLVLTRHGDMIDAEILGANGVQFDGTTLKKETRKLIPPAQIDIGADIKLEISKDDSPAAVAPATPQPQAAPTPVTPPEPPPASKSTPKETPALKAAPKVVPPVTMTEPPPPLKDFSQKKGGIAVLGGMDQKKIMIIGGVVAVVIILALILIFSGGSDDKATGEVINITPKEVQQFKTENIPQVEEQKALKEQGSNLHAMYIEEAKKLYQKGKMAEALEYLQDIPPNSSYYDEAQILVNKIGRR